MASTGTDLSLVGIEGLLSFIPGGGALSEALKGYRERKIAEARDILIEEVSRGNLQLSSAASVDDLLGVLVRLQRAILEGSARHNLRLLARVMVGLGQRDRLYASEFNRHADLLSTMTHDQLLVLGNVMRLTRLYQRTAGMAREEALQSAMSQYLGEGVQNGDFANQDAIMSVFPQLAANGLMLFESAYGGLTWSCTPLAWEIDDLVDLETVPRSAT